MGAGAVVIGLAILGVVVLLGWGIIAPIVGGLVDNISGTYTATQLQPRVGSDEIICDLQLIIPAELTSDILKFNSPQFIRIDDSKIIKNFFDCHNFSSFPSYALVDFQARLGQMTVISFGESIPVELTIRDASDPTQKVDKFTRPNLATTVKIKPTFSLNAVDASVEFVVTNIPLREYIGEVIYVGFPINDDTLPFSTPHKFSIKGN